MKTNKLHPIYDPVFKRIFGQEKEILIELINAFFKTEFPVVDIRFLPTELQPINPNDKISIVDVLCIDQQNRHFVMEIQLVKQKSFKERVHYYASRIMGRSLQKGQSYKDLAPVCVISLLNHIIEPESIDWLHRYSLSNEKSPEKKIKGIELIFIELEKWKKLGNFNIENDQERWLGFLTSPEKFQSMTKHELSKYPNLKKAVQLLDESNYSEGEMASYNSYLNKVMAWNMTMIENYDEGFEDGMEQGMEKGVEKGIEIGMEKGVEKGMAKGMEIGMEKGVEKGIEKGKSEQTELIYSIINLLKSKQLTKEEIASKVGVTIDFVERWS